MRKYGVIYEFDKEQRKVLNLMIMGSLSFRKARELLGVSSAGVYTMMCNYTKQLYRENKIKIYDGPYTVC